MTVQLLTPKKVIGFNSVIVVAWFFAMIFYFLQYALRSAPGVMIPELSASFNLTAFGVSSVAGIYFYGYSILSIVAGASLDRFGAKYAVPIGAGALALGAVMFGMGTVSTATAGRLLQGAGSAFAFTGAVYLAAQGFPARYLATIIGITQSVGMLGGAAGQFAVGPIITSGLPWQKFWLYSAVVVLIVAVVLFFATPTHGDRAHKERGSVWSMFAPLQNRPHQPTVVSVRDHRWLVVRAHDHRRYDLGCPLLARWARRRLRASGYARFDGAARLDDRSAGAGLFSGSHRAP